MVVRLTSETAGEETGDVASHAGPDDVFDDFAHPAGGQGGQGAYTDAAGREVGDSTQYVRGQHDGALLQQTGSNSYPLEL